MKFLRLVEILLPAMLLTACTATPEECDPMQYEFKDGKGSATITQSDGVKCTGAVKGGLAKGALSINAQSEAKCTDGSVYEMPKVVCTQGSDGNSDCVSTYQNSKTKKTTQFPMNLHR